MMNKRSPERVSVDSVAEEKTSLDLRGFEKYRYDPMASLSHKEVKDNVEKVMISKFMEKVQKKFPDPERDRETIRKMIMANIDDAEQMNFLLPGDDTTINVEEIPRTIYLNNKISQRTLGKLRD
jgi:hypothetical protein